MATIERSLERDPLATVSTACRPAPTCGSGGRTTSGPTHLSILGGGLAGLALGYHARRAGLGFTIYEAADRLGGNCVTLDHQGFRFDSGAHRFHDRDPAVTAMVKELLGEALEQTDAPSQLYYDGQLIDFPLAPLNLMKSLGWRCLGKVGLEVLYARLCQQRRGRDFEGFALYTYGKTIAQRFLLNYSQKLWGIPCCELSPEAAVKRLKGLDLRTFLAEAILGRKTRTRHLDGAFLYPRAGIGTIAEKLAEHCGPDSIHVNSTITKVLHDHARIRAVEINGKDRIDVQDVVSTQPLPHLLKMMEPPPPEEVLALARSLQFRDLILVALFLDRPRVTETATVYFPETAFPFTRVYEPCNRSAQMSPPGQTSLVAEISCDEEDSPRPGAVQEKWVETVRSRLIQIGWIRPREILDSAMVRMKCAYPVLSVDTPDTVRKLQSFLHRFTNLKVTGRNGRLLHASIHDILAMGEQVVCELTSVPRQ